MQLRLFCSFPNPFSRGWNNPNQSFLKLSHLCLLSSSGGRTRRLQSLLEAGGAEYTGRLFFLIFFFPLGKYFPAAGCGDSKHSCRGWRGEASPCGMAGAPSPSLPFPGCDPQGSAQKPFYAPSTGGGVCFSKGGKEELAWPPGNIQGSPGRSTCPQLTGKKGGLLKKKHTSDPEQGSRGCGGESTELLLFPAFFGSRDGALPTPSPGQVCAEGFREWRHVAHTWARSFCELPWAIPALGISIGF